MLRCRAVCATAANSRSAGSCVARLPQYGCKCSWSRNSIRQARILPDNGSAPGAEPAASSAVVNPHGSSTSASGAAVRIGIDVAGERKVTVGARPGLGRANSGDGGHTYRERRDIAEGPLRQALPVTRHVRDQLRPPRMPALPARYRRRNHFPVNMPIAAGEVLFLHSA